MKMNMNMPQKHDRRKRAILERQSESSGKYRGSPTIKPENLDKVEQGRMAYEARINKLSNWVAEHSGERYPNRSWVEVLDKAIAMKKIFSPDDQALIIKDLYDQHNSSNGMRQFDGIVIDEMASNSVSVKMQDWLMKICNHYDEIVEQKKQAGEFSSFLESL